MHTKPISTEVIASYEATLTSGFAPLDVAFDNGVGKLVLNTSDTVVPLKFKKYCDSLLTALNDGQFLPAKDMIDNLKNNGEFVSFPTEVNDHKDMQVVFQAVVTYPYIRDHFGLTEDVEKMFIDQITEHLQCRDEVRQLLFDYFDKVNKLEKVHAPILNNGIDLLECKDALLSIKKGTFFDRVPSNFPPELLPLSAEDSQKMQGKSEENTVFQRAYNEIHTSTTNCNVFDYRCTLFKLLPVIFIIKKMGSDELTEEQKEELFINLSAAKHFYAVLGGTEKKEGDKKTPSTLISQSIEAALKSATLKSVALKFDAIESAALESVAFEFDALKLKAVESVDLETEALKSAALKLDALKPNALVKTDIYQFLFYFHDLLRHFYAISACSRLAGNNDERRKNLCNLLKLDVFRSEEQLQRNLLLNPIADLVQQLIGGRSRTYDFRERYSDLVQRIISQKKPDAFRLLTSFLGNTRW